jgi:hypothetical protein
MIRQSIINYYVFGTEMRYLQDAASEVTVQGSGFISDNIDRFLANLKALGLNVTLRAALRLREFADELKSSEAMNLSADQAEKLRTIMHELRLTLDAEIFGVSAFITTPKRISLARIIHEGPIRQPASDRFCGGARI